MGTAVAELIPSTQKAQDPRRRTRLKVSLPAHVRPFDARYCHIEDVAQVANFTREGLYFTTRMPHYLVGMRLIVTFPFGDNVSAHRKFLATIVRLEEKDGENRGVGVRLLL
jgi:hypothetical protein